MPKYVLLGHFPEIVLVLGLRKAHWIFWWQWFWMKYLTKVLEETWVNYSQLSKHFQENVVNNFYMFWGIYPILWKPGGYVTITTPFCRKLSKKLIGDSKIFSPIFIKLCTSIDIWCDFPFGMDLDHLSCLRHHLLFFLGFLTSVNPFWRPFFRKRQKFIKWRWFSLLSQSRHFYCYILMAGEVKFVTCLENSSSKFNRPVTESFGIISTVLYQVVVTELFWSK